MSKFDYFRAQVGNNVWAVKQILTVYDTVLGGVNSGKYWYFSLPHIQFVMGNSVMAGIKDLLVASQNVGRTIVDCSLVFLETVNAINRAYNSRAFSNLANKGQQELASLLPSSRERAIYEASVMAYNESLNLPQLSVTIDSIDADIRSIQQGGKTAEAQLDTWKNNAISRIEQLKSEILATID